MRTKESPYANGRIRVVDADSIRWEDAQQVREARPRGVKAGGAESEFLFELLAATVGKGERCPTRDDLAGALYNNKMSRNVPAVLEALTDARRIRIYVYAENWRVVQITDEKHPLCGKRTQGPPRGGRPIRTIDGPREKSRAQPWKPGTPKPTRE